MSKKEDAIASKILEFFFLGLEECKDNSRDVIILSN